jgi:hypothetical protein
MFFKNLKPGLPCDPAIPLLHIYSEEYKPTYNRDICIPMFTAAVFTIAKL